MTGVASGGGGGGSASFATSGVVSGSGIGGAGGVDPLIKAHDELGITHIVIAESEARARHYARDLRLPDRLRLTILPQQNIFPLRGLRFGGEVFVHWVDRLHAVLPYHVTSEVEREIAYTTTGCDVHHFTDSGAASLALRDAREEKAKTRPITLSKGDGFTVTFDMKTADYRFVAPRQNGKSATMEATFTAADLDRVFGINQKGSQEMFITNAIETKAGWVGQVKHGSKIVWESVDPKADEPARYDEDGDRISKTGRELAIEAAQARIDEAVSDLFNDVRPIAG